MKHLQNFFIVAGITVSSVVVFVFIAFGQDSTAVIPVVNTGNAFIDQALPYTISIIIPLLIGLIRKYIPSLKIPKWSIPIIIVPLLGLGMSWIYSMIGAGNLAWYQGVGLGLLGIALREVQDQVKKLATGE